MATTEVEPVVSLVMNNTLTQCHMEMSLAMQACNNMLLTAFDVVIKLVDREMIESTSLEDFACRLARAREALAEPGEFRYWVCYDKNVQKHVVVRSRINPQHAPANVGWGLVTAGGPFDSEEDAARSLAFWRSQPNPASDER